MASDSKLASNPVTKEIESRLKQAPEHIFQVFLEVREPIDKEVPEILRKYPADYVDESLKTTMSFVYPCKIPSDEQGEHFAFVVLDATGTLFRFGYCRRSNREATCLCIISFYPWFETFYNMLNDIAQIMTTKDNDDLEKYLSSLYNYKLKFDDDRSETIEISSLVKSYQYIRPDMRQLPSVLTNKNFSVMLSRLGPEIMLSLFAHLLYERRILFVSSKLSHLSACAMGCLHLIYPMHWQSLFLPILPQSMLWTTQCSTPYIIGVHTSLFQQINRNELDDAIIVNIDERKLETEYNDLQSFPKMLSRSMKKGIQQSSQKAGDHLARVFLRGMAYTVGNYANGFIIRNEKLDFDRALYLEQYLGSHVHPFMSAVAQTQSFEQFSRYRTYLQLQRETDIDEFDLEVKNYQQLQQSKKFKANKRIYKLIEKAANPIIEQVQTKAGKVQTVISKAGQRVANEATTMKNNLSTLDINGVIKRPLGLKNSEAHVPNRFSLNLPLQQSSSIHFLDEKSIHYERFNVDQSPTSPQLHDDDEDDDDESSSDSSRSSTPEPEPNKSTSLINFDTDNNDLLPTPIILNVINTPASSSASTNRLPATQVESKIKQLQNTLKEKVQTFDGKRVDPREELGQQSEIKRLVKQFDPLDEKTSQGYSPSSSSVILRSNLNKSIGDLTDRHPSLFESIPTNRVANVLQNLQANYGTTTRTHLKSSQTNPNLIEFSPPSASTNGFLTNPYPNMSQDPTVNFDPLAPINQKKPSSNLIDF